MTLIPHLSFYLNLNLFPMFVLNSYLTHVQIFNNLNLKILRSTLLSSLICQFWESKGHYSFPTYFKWFFLKLFTPRHFQGFIITEFKFLSGMNQFLRCWYFCLFGCSAINFDKGTRENHGNVFSFVNFKGKNW